MIYGDYNRTHIAWFSNPYNTGLSVGVFGLIFVVKFVKRPYTGW